MAILYCYDVDKTKIKRREKLDFTTTEISNKPPSTSVCRNPTQLYLQRTYARRKRTENLYFPKSSYLNHQTHPHEKHR